MVMESKFGKMVLSTRASGRTIKLTEKAHSGMQMEIFTRVSFVTINQMATAYSIAQMAQSMKACGSMISSMGQDRHTGQMVPAILDTIWRADAMALALTSGRMETHIAANGPIML